MTDMDRPQGGVSSERWQAAQDHEADFWLRSRPLGAMPNLVRWHLPAIKAADVFLQDDARILEVGAGPTCTARLFEKGEKTYTDPLMDTFRKHMPHLLPEGEILACPGEAIPFEDDRFDVVLSVNALDHARSPVKCMEEIARVLKPAGRFILGLHSHNSMLLKGRKALESLGFRIGSDPHPNEYDLKGLKSDLRLSFDIENAERAHRKPGLLGPFHREYWVFTARPKGHSDIITP